MTRSNIEREESYASEKVLSVDELEREIGRLFIEREDIKAAERRVNAELTTAQELLRETKERNEGKLKGTRTTSIIKAEEVTSVTKNYSDRESNAVKAELVEDTIEDTSELTNTYTKYDRRSIASKRIELNRIPFDVFRRIKEGDEPRLSYITSAGRKSGCQPLIQQLGSRTIKWWQKPTHKNFEIGDRVYIWNKITPLYNKVKNRVRQKSNSDESVAISHLR